jgi:putative zinc finger/helix-turn-helix YgiT family protein
MKSMTRKCPECGREALSRKTVTHVATVGGVKVTDATASALVCSACGKYDLWADELAGYERRAAIAVLRDGRAVDGDVVRFARKALGLRQIDLAEILQKSPENISRWETGDIAIPRAEQLALVALLESGGSRVEIADWVVWARRSGRAAKPRALDVLPPVWRARG